MRTDKFLQLSRLVKQRSFANQACDRGYVLVNGKPAKPSSPVSVGDRITLDLPAGRIEVEVLALPTTKSVSREEAKTLYRVIAASDKIN